MMKNIIQSKESLIRGMLSDIGHAHLVVIQVGDNPSSNVYVRNKVRKLTELGASVEHVRLPEQVTELELLQTVKEKSVDADGLLVQLPLPDHISEDKVVEAVPQHIDVDGFSCYHQGKIMQGDAEILPCTVQAVIDVLESRYASLAGFNIAVIGRSNIVGKPLAVELVNRRATVTSMNTASNRDKIELSNFDVIVAATGKHGVVKASELVPGQLVIDVGINYVNGKLVGDVEHDRILPDDIEVTPVPGGVGRMTVLNVGYNLCKLAMYRK